MLHYLSTLLGRLRVASVSSAPQEACFHCGDPVRRRHAVTVQFDGASRQVCCHGCAAILNTVEQMGMQQQYREQKNTGSQAQ